METRFMSEIYTNFLKHKIAIAVQIRLFFTPQTLQSLYIGITYSYY